MRCLPLALYKLRVFHRVPSHVVPRDLPTVTPRRKSHTAHEKPEIPTVPKPAPNQCDDPSYRLVFFILWLSDHRVLPNQAAQINGGMPGGGILAGLRFSILNYQSERINQRWGTDDSHECN
jgi:hypothetical protein